MKKTLRGLLSGAFALVLALPAVAQEDMSYTFGYCEDVPGEQIGGLGAGQKNMWISGAIKIPKAQLQEWQVNGASAIQFGYGTGIAKSCTVFLSTSLKAAPYFTQDVTADQRPGWNECAFDPQTVDTSKDLYVGWYVKTLANSDYPIGTDMTGDTGNPNGILLAMTNSGEASSKLWGAFQDYSKSGNGFGNVCVRVTLTGTAFPSNIMNFKRVELPKMMRPNTPIDAQITLGNAGGNDINSFTLQYTLGDGAPVSMTYNLDEPLKPFGNANVHLTMKTAIDSFDLPMVITLTNVNDVACEPAPTYEENIICSDNSFPRTMVVEESTCLGCGYCPRGWVGLEYMKEHYGDKGDYIGISAHNTQQGSDPMACSAYNGWFSKYCGGNPSCTVNRMYSDDPNWMTLEQYYGIIAGSATYAKVDVSAEFEDDVITANATAVFGMDIENGKYAVTFVQVEDGLGPYKQANYFSGSNSGGLATEFESLPNPCSIMYNDVARDISGWSGISRSIPSSIKAFEPVEYSKKLNSAVDNPENSRLVVLLLDQKTGQIVNAAQCKFGQSAVSDILSNDEKQPVEYFNLQGMRVDNPQNGVYIRRQGNKTTKVAL